MNSSIKTYSAKILVFAFLMFTLFTSSVNAQHELNVVVIGAHPDDADIRAGGTAIRYAQAGHKVLFVSLTNGDAGHHEKGGGALAHIRRSEAEEAGRRFGVEYVVLDNHDGELMPTLENRLEVIRLIRGWNADLVFGPRPYDYHPDHRNTAILVQDAAYMVIVPNVASDVPPLEKNPVFMYVEDGFQKPYPFRPDIVVDITGQFDQKIYAMAAHESQMFEWLPWTSQRLDQVPQSEQDRLKWLAEWRKPRLSDDVKKAVEKWYGPQKAATIQAAEAFEICEYGRRPTEEELKILFPFFN